MKSAESAFDRSLKTLAKLQKERQRAAETDAKREASEAQKTDLRNEATSGGRERSKEVAAGSCVASNGAIHGVKEARNGELKLSADSHRVESQPREVAATAENGV
jgi:hypothetical protein